MGGVCSSSDWWFSSSGVSSLMRFLGVRWGLGDLLCQGGVGSYSDWRASSSGYSSLTSVHSWISWVSQVAWDLHTQLSLGPSLM